MKTVILAGGLGTRISEESHLKPKPMIEIGEIPVIVHIMKIYAAQGFCDFIICAGYKQHVIKEYFSNYFLYNSDVTFDIGLGQRTFHNKPEDDWRITVVDTGLATQTGGRVKRIAPYVGHETFMLTYGDGVGDVDIRAMLELHKKQGKVATITCYGAGQSKGIVEVEGDEVQAFREKADEDGSLINIGFMAFEPVIFELLEGDDTILERKPLETLARQHEISAYVHKGFWQCMDTLREKQHLEELWQTGAAPWKIW